MDRKDFLKSLVALAVVPLLLDAPAESRPAKYAPPPLPVPVLPQKPVSLTAWARSQNDPLIHKISLEMMEAGGLFVNVPFAPKGGPPMTADNANAFQEYVDGLIDYMKANP